MEESIISGISPETTDLTYKNISLYIRDTDLTMDNIFTMDLLKIYQISDDVCVRSSVDGLGEKEVRLYILSNHVTPLEDKDGKHLNSDFLMPKGSRFKYIARSTYHDKACAIFLHLPDVGYEEFYNDTMNIDTLLINYATREFEVQCEIPSDKKAHDSFYDKQKKFDFTKVEMKQKKAK